MDEYHIGECRIYQLIHEYYTIFFCFENFCVLSAYYVPNFGKENMVELKEYI